MKKNIASFNIEDIKAFKIKMLNWSSRFNIFCFLDNNQYSFEDPAFECLLAVDCIDSIQLKNGGDLQDLLEFSTTRKGWLFGHFGYDLFNSPAQIVASPEVDFGNGFFFVPRTIVKMKRNRVIIEGEGDLVKAFDEINAQPATIKPFPPAVIHFEAGIGAGAYKEIITDLKGHILRGDCYEINYCQHFFATGTAIDPLYFYHRLMLLSPNPFGVFYKTGDKFCLCASPERFLKKTGNKLISQPIKGTSKRNLTDPQQDGASKAYLQNSPKEKSENVMVVDLVRNDLSKVCTEGSVRVRELCGVYSFPQVHQMISTIEGEVEAGTAWTDIIKACFPMGSMTGAPKKKVVELIARYEPYPRGLFSGSIGYMTPDGDFDFNVVIRSLMYDERKKVITFKAGGGITFQSDAGSEYEECLLKAEAIIRILKNTDQ